MGIIDGFRRQLRSVIEWENDDGSQLFTQWTDNGDEIKNASQLVLKPGQGCIFVYRGRVKAMWHREGVYNLKTANIPFITTVMKVMQFFESEHKVGIYFFRKTLVVDQKWGTSAPIKYQDPKYDIPVGLKAYGNYSYRLSNPKSFFVHLLGSREAFSIEELRSVITQRMTHPLSDFLAESSFSYAEIDSHRDEIAQGLLPRLELEFSKLGIRLTDLRIEGTDFDEDTVKRIGRVADVTVDAIAAKKAGLDYAELQQLEALKAAASNESGAAGAGVGIGAGIGLGQQMSEGMANAMSSKTDKTNTKDENDILGAMMKLKQLYEMDAITEQEYADKKRELLDKL